MNKEPERLEQNSGSTLISLKIMILLFCVTPITQMLFSLQTAMGMMTLTIMRTFIFFGVVLVVALFCFIINFPFKHKRVRTGIELFVMMAMGSLCYIATGVASSGYKFVFVLIVTIYTMELGKRTGFILSAIAGVVLLSGDYIDTFGTNRSDYFQADLMLIVTFFLVSYIVGWYVKRDNQLIKHLQDSANHDALTDLFNHRYFHQYMHSLFNSAPPADESQFLFIADIDFFKVYNDTFGHPKGDIVLKEIASISSEIFDGGLVSRYGGEEFAFVASAKDAAEACDLANRLCERVYEYPFEGEELMPGHRLTISIGVAERKSTGDTVADWIARADNALYKAKSFRKNRVELYTPVYDRFDHLDQVNDDERIISIKTLLSVIDARDRYTRNHTEHVVEFCETFARFAKLSDEESQKLISSAYLHDIGKINISKETLITEKRLTDKQWEEIRKHPADGADIVRKMKDSDEIADIVLQHHEKFDGTGYPNHVAGKDLHKLARILTLADSFDAMTTKRNYQRARTYEEAFEEIRRCAGTQFDPELSEIFIRAINETYR